MSIALPKKGKAVILLSGGVDSAVTAVIAKGEGYELFALSFDYGQRHRVELECAKRVADHLGVQKHMVISFDLRNIGGSALTAAIEVPKGRGKGTEVKQEMSADSPASNLPHLSSVIPVTYVPARNTIFLSFALGWAEVLEVQDIFIGVNAVDYSGYPDCRPEYLKAFEDMANLATKVSVEGRIRFRINAPLLHMKKAEIIRRGAKLGLDYGLTWSCYDPQERQRLQNRGQKIDSPASGFCLPPSHDYVPCGRCDSCLIRAKGFEEAGLKDPAAGI